jgi:hypothetical protein
MSDGHYCFVRDLGPVKGGKGMRHHEVIIDLNRRGIAALLKRLLVRPQRSGSPRRLREQSTRWDETLAARVSAIARPSPPYRDIG